MLHLYILAAGKGTRMRSQLPKVLHLLAGRPMLAHVLDSCVPLNAEHTFVVVGHGADQVKAAFAERKLTFIEQQQQLGTGHAVLQGLGHFQAEATVLILFGDVPLIQLTALEQLVAAASDSSLGLLTVTLANPTGYGRIVRDERGEVARIVEQKDASAEEQAIKEVNTGIMAVKAQHLYQWLPRLQNNNVQQEYYLPDIIAMAVADGVKIITRAPTHEYEVMGINDRAQQAQLERIFQRHCAQQLMQQGLTLLDPARFDCRGELKIDTDCVVDINCVFEGSVSLGKGVSVGPNCVIKNSVLKDGVKVEANSIIEDSMVEQDCTVGPYARLRPGTHLKEGARIGNFVETKKATVGRGSKINHLSYIGDAELGEAVNVGAGTITCNYDGANKLKTTIGNRVFVGSNSALVAPVTIKDGATIAAGSTVTTNVDADQLAVARARQKNIDGWQRPSKKK